MNYEKNYYDYTEYVKTLSRKKGNEVYYERHHIVPKCAGGKDTPENLVLLTAREHFLAHYLLTKIYKDTPYSYNLDYAFICMKRDGHKQQRYLNSRLYESIKARFAKEISENNKGREAWNKGIPRPESVKQAISKANKGRSAWNKGKKMPAHSEESNKKRAETLKRGYLEGRYVDRKGKVPWNKGKRKPKKIGPGRHGHPKVMTTEQQEKVITYYLEGKTPNWIAKEFQISHFLATKWIEEVRNAKQNDGNSN